MFYPRYSCGKICKYIFRRCLSSSSKVQSNSLPLDISKFGDKLAIQDSSARFTYSQLFQKSQLFKEHVLQSTGRSNLDGERVAILTSNDASFGISLFTTWMSGGIAVPLCPQHPKPELKYVLEDTKASAIVSSSEHHEVAHQLSSQLGISHISVHNFTKMPISTNKQFSVNYKDDNYGDKPSLIVYTSGTTGRPKGVVFTHRSISAQVNKMVSSWEWEPDNVILHVLPLHHVHGLVNCLLCPLFIGATVKMLPKFDPAIVWEHLLNDVIENPVNVFMAVPTIYFKLIEYFDKNKLSKNITREKCQRIKLMVSGSAALPTTLYRRWKEITGHSLLERYGMTEFGMGMTNPLHGKRTPGGVGLPFPGVKAKIIQNESNDVQSRTIVEATHCEVTKLGDNVNKEGELLIKSDSMFEEYWNKSEEAKNSFTNGWFKTGDTAKFEDGSFFILGRTSVDIIKSGGFKISALDIERKLLEQSSISEVAVLGVPDEVYGQWIVAIIVKREEISENELKLWCKENLPPYQVPREFKILDKIPRNVMGKVNKKQLLKKYYP